MPAQRLERGLVDAAALAAEQPTLDRLPGEVVAEAEHVGVGLDEQPAADEAAQHRDELGLADAGDRGEHVERHPPAEHRRGLDHVALGRLELVDLAAHDLGQVPRQRLRAELLDRHAARGDEQLLEEERVAAGAGVQALGHPERHGAAVDRDQEVLHADRRRAG